MFKYVQQLTLVLIASAIGVICCGKKERARDISDVHYSLGVNAGGVSYSLPVKDLEKGAFQVENIGTRLDATSMIASGKYFYFFSKQDKKYYQYQFNTDGSIAKKAELAVSEYVAEWAYSQNLVNDSTLLIMDPVKWGEPAVKWLTIRIPDMVISGSGQFDLPAREQKPGKSWKSNVGNGVLHAGKFLMGTVYYDFDGNFAPGAHMVAFDFPGMTNPTLISTDVTDAELGIYSTNSFSTTSDGDLYIAACRGALVGSKTDSKMYGGILRIRKGETKFDETYFLDFTKALGVPTNILQLDELNGTSAMAILFDDTRIKGWGDIANDHYFFAKIDLSAGTVSRYNVPKSDAHSAKRPLIEGNKYISFLKSTANKTTNVLEIDLSGGPDAFQLGALLEGKNVKGYSVSRHPNAP